MDFDNKTILLDNLKMKVCLALQLNKSKRTYDIHLWAVYILSLSPNKSLQVSRHNVANSDQINSIIWKYKDEANSKVIVNKL